MGRKHVIGLGVLSLALSCLPLAAQENNWCTDHGRNSDGVVRHSEVREEHLAPGASETVVNPDQNGSIRVHAWEKADILVKACVQTAAPSSQAAEAMAQQVTITNGAGQVVAKGPTAADNSWWSVSYEIWAPAAGNLELQANNGSIHVEGTSGRIRAHSSNGSLKVINSSGDFEGETTNGSLTLELTNAWHGSGLKLKTVNGSIHLQLPDGVGAEVEASTVNGSLSSDFGQLPKEERHNARFTIGAGGPKIEAETVNGSVHISRQG